MVSTIAKQKEEIATLKRTLALTEGHLKNERAKSAELDMHLASSREHCKCLEAGIDERNAAHRSRYAELESRYVAKSHNLDVLMVQYKAIRTALKVVL